MSDKLNIPELDANIPRLGNRFSQWLGKTVLRTLGWSFNGPFPTHKKMVLAVAPHTSNWDFVIGLAVVFALRLKITFFGKHSIFFPPFDRLLKRWGGIPIERSRAHGVVSQITGQMKEAETMLLCIAPEGTRSRIYPWKTGFLQIAHHADVPLVLVSLDYARKQIQIDQGYKVSSDIESELRKVYQHYSTVSAKYPDKICCFTEKNFD